MDHVARHVLKYTEYAVWVWFILGSALALLRPPLPGWQRSILAILICLFLAAEGVVLLMRPRLVQQEYLRYYDEHPRLARFHLGLSYIRAGSFTIHLRACGLIALLMALVIVLAMARQLIW